MYYTQKVYPTHIFSSRKHDVFKSCSTRHRIKLHFYASNFCTNLTVLLCEGPDYLCVAKLLVVMYAGVKGHGLYTYVNS